MVYHSQLDVTFFALADPTRREILSRLAGGERTISELEARFDMSLPAVSKHVRMLERAGLASVERQGRVRRAKLTAGAMRPALEWIERYRQYWESQLDQLAAYLEGTSSVEASWPKKQSTPSALPPLLDPQASPPQAAPRRRSKSAAPSARPANASSTRGRKRKS